MTSRDIATNIGVRVGSTRLIDEGARPYRDGSCRQVTHTPWRNWAHLVRYKWSCGSESVTLQTTSVASETERLNLGLGVRYYATGYSAPDSIIRFRFASPRPHDRPYRLDASGPTSRFAPRSVN